ncbi:alkaline phosphatase PhoX, partial [Escherichia coli]
AKFNDDGKGEWLPLVFGQNGLDASKGFENQGDLLIKTRLAADAVGATKMDRPEWIAVDPYHAGSVYCTLTNNSDRG